MTRDNDLFADDLFNDDLFGDDLFDFDDIDEPISSSNIYLDNPEKGLALISQLLNVSKKTKNQMKDIRRLDRLIDYRLLQSINKIQLKNEVELYHELIKFSDKLFEQNKIALLKNKKTIGIGGQFSAGKSKFINSIIGTEILPEDQAPTTSIATYILKGKMLKTEALTSQNEKVPLDLEAVKALSHAFYEKYQLGFSQFIHNLVISAPEFPYDSIAILDTPGYSKDDANKKQSISDSEKALAQLKSVDYLIWLIDIENGVMKQADIQFIESLHLKNPVLIVFNKCDKKTESDIAHIVSSTEELLKETNIPVHGIVAYSSQEQEEYLQKNILKKFLQNINKQSNTYVSLEDEIKKIIAELEQQIQAHAKSITEKRNEIGTSIFRSDDISEINTLVKVYAMLQQQLKEVNNCRNTLRRTKEQIFNKFNVLAAGGAK